MINQKDNYLMALRGEHPEYVPRFSFGPRPGETKPPVNWALHAPALSGHRNMQTGGKDIWGVSYVPTYETGNALIPEPNNFILEDVTKWRDVIKAPDLTGIDWEKMVKDQLEAIKLDRSQTSVTLSLHVGYFQTFMAFMGFTNGLIALIEEPDEVSELMQYLADFYIGAAENFIDLYKPDIINLTDDTAAWHAPFISANMYREFCLPHHDRWAKMGRDRGLIIAMHNCGKCEGVVDQFLEMGVNMWEPAQTCNDLDAIQAKYGNTLTLGGCWDPNGHLLDPECTEEEIRASVLETMEKRAIGGGFIWAGNFLGPVDDLNVKRKNEILNRAVEEIGRDFYKTHA